MLDACIFLDLGSLEQPASDSVLSRVRTCANLVFPRSQVIDCTKDGLAHAWYSRPLDTQRSCFFCFIAACGRPTDFDVGFALFAARIPTLIPSCASTSSDRVMQCELLSMASGGGESLCDDDLRAFFPSTVLPPGRIVVIEGGDGAGKATQTSMLVGSLQQHKCCPFVKTLDFPRDGGLYGDVLRILLSGKKGKINTLNPLLFSFIYSLNRFGCLPEMIMWKQRGAVVVLDRYYTANFGHQASKLPEQERTAFITQLEEMEVQWLGLPPADLVFYLDLPPELALKAMHNDATRAALDIHETAGVAYKENVRRSFLWCCHNLPRWKHVTCVDGTDTRRSRDDIHAQLRQVVTQDGSSC